jgi:hypothetical protein
MTLFNYLAPHIATNVAYYADISQYLYILDKDVEEKVKTAKRPVVRKAPEPRTEPLFRSATVMRWTAPLVGTVLATAPTPPGRPIDSLAFSFLFLLNEKHSEELLVKKSRELTQRLFSLAFEHFDTHSKKYPGLGKVKDVISNIIRGRRDNSANISSPVIQLLADYFKVTAVVLESEKEPAVHSPSPLFCSSTEGATVFPERPIIYLFRRGAFFQPMRAARSAKRPGQCLFIVGEIQERLRKAFRVRQDYTKWKVSELQVEVQRRGHNIKVVGENKRLRRLRKAELIAILKKE